MGDFYVTLPSDSSYSVYPDNTVAHFRTKLSSRICSETGYEVAVTKVIYPSCPNFGSVEKLEAKICFSNSKRIGTEIGTWTLPNGYFKTEDELIKFMSVNLTKFINNVCRLKFKKLPGSVVPGNVKATFSLNKDDWFLNVKQVEGFVVDGDMSF
jgi:hypothetical protein